VALGMLPARHDVLRIRGARLATDFPNDVTRAPQHACRSRAVT
jgi:hypothetical protein